MPKRRAIADYCDLEGDTAGSADASRFQATYRALCAARESTDRTGCQEVARPTRSQGSSDMLRHIHLRNRRLLFLVADGSCVWVPLKPPTPVCRV